MSFTGFAGQAGVCAATMPGTASEQSAPNKNGKYRVIDRSSIHFRAGAPHQLGPMLLVAHDKPVELLGTL